MAIFIPSTWQERSMAFVQACLRNYGNMSSEEALDQCIIYAGALAEAGFALVLTEEDPHTASVFASSEPELKGIIFKFSINDPRYNLIEFHDISFVSLPGELSTKANLLLAVPLPTQNFSGILVFGFDKKPENITELKVFSELVQGIFRERLNLQLIKNSLENSRQRFDKLLHSIPEAVIILEENRNNAWTNQSAADLLSLPGGTVNLGQAIAAIKNLSKKAKNREDLEKEIRDLLPIKCKDIENWPWYFTDPNPLLLHVSCSSIDLANSSGTIWTFKDVTHKLDTRYAQDQIQELSNLLSSVLNSSLSGIMAFQSKRDKKGKIINFECLIANEAAKNMVGKKEYDIIGQKLLVILPGNLKEGLFDKYVEVVETGEPLYLEHYYIIEGKKTWYQTIANKLKDGFVVTFSDITKRKNAEEKLRQNQANLEALLENTDDFIWSINNDFKITAINSSFQEKVLHQTGHSLKVGDNFELNIFPQKSIKIWKKYFSRVFKGERFTEEFQVNIIDKDYFFEYSFNPIFDEIGKVTGVTVFGRNVTSRINSEQIIRQQSQMLKSLLNNLPILVFRVDPEGKIIESMGAALKNLNVPENELPEKVATELFPDLKYEVKKIKKGKNTTFLSQTFYEGKKYFFENYIFPDETNPGGAIGFSIDVTDLKQIEQEVKKAKEAAERANHAKSYFLANMSHDIRTPIHTILGFAQALKNQELSSSKSLEYLNYVISSGELLYKLVDDILELTKIEEGKLELKEEPFHFKQTLLSSLYPYQFQANEKGLQFVLEFDDSIPSYVIGDAGKISRIIINLIGNSLKFTRKGFIEVSFTCLASPGNDFNEYKIKVSVTDTGIGIPKEKQDIIFNSFTQAEPSINRKFGGSGLGLAIVRELVELMGGELGVESPVNNNPEDGGFGSVFWFTLPLKAVDFPDKLKIIDLPSEEINYREKLKVLLVEDNHINQQLVKAMLNKIGCKVTMADNGQEAIDLLKKEKFDLVLMDVQMPVLDGLEATRKIRKDINLSLPIIGLSAHIYKDDIENCLESGMNDYLGKPFSEKNLQDKIKQWVPKDFQFNNPSHQGENLDFNKVTDLSFLTNLYNGDSSAIGEMIKDYILFQNRLLDQMEENYNNKNYKKLAPLAHKMRSSIRTVGLESLYEPLVELETEANGGIDQSIIKGSFDKVKKLCQQAAEELKTSF